jgi:COP9 signalosome complex subunit 4
VQSLPAAQHLDTATFALEKMNPRVVSFEEQVSVLREGLAALHQAGKEWGKAAHVLAGIDLDSGIRVLTDEFKLQKCVQIAMLYLEDDDALNAETFIKKASFLLAACKVRGLTNPQKISPCGGRSRWSLRSSIAWHLQKSFSNNR